MGDARITILAFALLWGEGDLKMEIDISVGFNP
jgi:hypothetical protein